MKKLLSYGLLIIVLLGVAFYNDTISNFIMTNFIYKREIVVESPNKYKKDIDVQFVKPVNDFEPHSKKDLMNILYTILNNGWDEFTFFCDPKYKSCVDDINNLISDKNLVSNLNNFVHPYNTYNRMFVNYNNFGKITINVEKIYSNDQIKLVDAEIDRIINILIKPTMSDTEKIKIFHDYIINNTIYDSENADKLKANKEVDTSTFSHSAYGLLFNHKALCGGYSDTMSIFLDKIGITNIKISNVSHVWNLVLIDGKWLHLDLTWDDPVVNTNENLLLHNYFLITNTELQTKDNTNHKFDQTIYSEGQ